MSRLWSSCPFHVMMPAAVRIPLTVVLYASHSTGIDQRQDGTNNTTKARPTPLRRAASRAALARTLSESAKRVDASSRYYSEPFQLTKTVKSIKDCPVKETALRHDSTWSHAWDKVMPRETVT